MSDERDLPADDGLDADLAASIASALAPIAPSPAQSLALRARVLGGVDGTSIAMPAVRSISVDERLWQPFAPGVEICVLFENAWRRSVMLRMSAGSALPPHHHDMDEESVILEGDARVGKTLALNAGDYQYMPAGTPHPVITTVTGCIVLVHGERRPRVRMTPRVLAKLARRMVERCWR